MSLIDSDSSDIRNSFDDSENPKLFTSECKFVADKILIVGKEKIYFKQNTNCRRNQTFIPQIKGLETTNYLTSDQALRLDKQPQILTIIGGGFIAAELGHYFGSLGTVINIIQKRKSLIPNEDEEISKKFTEIFSKKYNIYLDCTAKLVTKKDDKFVDFLQRVQILIKLWKLNLINY